MALRLHLAFVFSAIGALAQTPVILISIDTLRADHLSAYGYKKIRTPNMDAFAGGGTLFANASTQIPLTLPSHTVLFTSTYPFVTKIEENAEPVGPGVVTLASVLQLHGYQTAAFIGSVFLEKQLGLDKGFDVYDSPFSFTAFSALSGEMVFTGHNRYAVRESRDGALVLRAATEWLAGRRGKPFFAFVHLFDMHQPYRRPGGYDAQLTYVDEALGRFRQMLVRTGLWDRALVVVVSDHGEGLGDHGEDNHGYFIYRSTLWVPLLMHWPAGTAVHPARVNEPCGLIDVAPTVLDFLHVAVPESFQGRSLLGAGQHSVYSESVYAHDAFGWAALRGLRSGKYQLIDAPHAELYDLDADPREVHNLVKSEAAEAARLRGELAKLLARHASRPGAQPARISSLGYLAAGPGVSLGSGGPDPKDRLAEYRLYEKAEAEADDGRTADAIAVFRSIIERDPHNTLARRDLGQCYIEAREYAKARTAFQQVLAVAPGDYLSHLGASIADQHLGLLPEARSEREAACKIVPTACQN